MSGTEFLHDLFQRHGRVESINLRLWKSEHRTFFTRSCELLIDHESWEKTLFHLTGYEGLWFVSSTILSGVRALDNGPLSLNIDSLM